MVSRPSSTAALLINLTQLPPICLFDAGTKAADLFSFGVVLWVSGCWPCIVPAACGITAAAHHCCRDCCSLRCALLHSVAVMQTEA